MNSCSNKSQNKKTAFTLVELLVSISILAVMATLSISSYPKFSEQIGLSSETYKILAHSKETQAYGISAVTSPGLRYVYAIYVDKSTGTIKRQMIESPTDRTNQYYVNTLIDDPSATTLTIKNIYKIDKICGDTECSTEYDKAYAFFRRPNPEARLVGLIGTTINPGTNTESLGRLEITLTSNKTVGIKKKIVILQTGQMYVSDW